MALPLEGKTAVVTGSSRGIGKAIALALARDGANVVVCARTEQSTDDLPGSIGETAGLIEAMGRRVLSLRCDVTNDDDVRDVLDKTLATFGKIDILINNAGITGGGMPSFLDSTAASLDNFYRTNVRGPYVLTHLAAAKMASAGGGTIFNISSGAARNVLPPGDPAGAGRRPGTGIIYGMSKAALDRLSTGVASELFDQKVAVISIYPGFTATERTRRSGIDVSRAEQPETTAKAVAFLAREPMAYTGQILTARDVVNEHAL